MSIKYVTTTDFPVPPIERFPTPILGVLNFLLLKKPKWKKRFLIWATVPYKNASGKRRNLRYFIKPFLFIIKFRKNKNSFLLQRLKFLQVKDNIIFVTMRIQKIIDVIEEWAPPSHAEDFDNVGLIIGDPLLECKGILVTHDTLENVVDECINKDFNLIAVSYTHLTLPTICSV